MSTKTLHFLDVPKLIQDTTTEYAKAKEKSIEEVREIVESYINSFLNIPIGAKREYPLLGPGRGNIIRIDENTYHIHPFHRVRK
ncbi:MAG: hypothetical protein IPJ67_04555 [Candidatus Moraniibacteriota bacterium]|nr:MAG: hypothetical protein IPJ67_04555 [Candidatus Moranbacteria bacterium]